MALSTDPELVRRALTILNAEPYLWLWVVVADETEVGSPAFYVVRDMEPVTFQPPGEASPVEFEPYPMNVSALRTVRESAMTQLDLTVANVGGAISYWIEQGDGFLGKPAECYVLAKDNVAAGALFSAEFTVGSIVEQKDVITFRMETPNYFSRDVPRDTITRDRCQRRFKDRGCGYFGTGVTSCDKSYANCVAVGEDERANGFLKLHPERFLSAPGLSPEG